MEWTSNGSESNLEGGLVRGGRSAVTIWMLLAMIIAVRQALDYQSTFRAVGVCLMGWFIFVVILVWSLLLFSGGNSLTQ